MGTPLIKSPLLRSALALENFWDAPLFYIVLKLGDKFFSQTLKQTMILASSLSTVGSWIKVCSVEPDRFLLAFISQCLVSTSYTFTFGVSAQLIATWFGVHESSRASAMSLFGDQVNFQFNAF